MAKKKAKRRGIKIGVIIFMILFVIAAYLFAGYYQKVYAASVSVSSKDPFLYVQSDWNRNDLVEHLVNEQIIQDTSSFIWVANRKGFHTVKPGKYKLRDGMSNNSLVNLIRLSGNRTPVRLTFNTIRTKNDLAGKVSKQIEADSLEILNIISSAEEARKYGFNQNTFFTLFIPNTYEVQWNMSAEEFVKRMALEYKRFWNADRKAKARKLNLSQSEVAILASIVQAEQSSKPVERPRVAGLYINRMRKKMRLDSDPTLIFAMGDFTIRRVLNKHKALNSPYNTYKYAGLPPGPINLPEQSSLKAVLNYESHDYIFMCAKPDFSGFHNFSRSYAQHQVYARKFQEELNRRNIMH